MEAIVSKDYKKWLDILKIESGSSKQKQQFEILHNEFQQVLNSDITATAVQQICRTVVSAEELYDMIRARASQLSKLGKMKNRKLGDSSSDEENLQELEDAF